MERRPRGRRAATAARKTRQTKLIRPPRTPISTTVRSTNHGAATIHTRSRFRPYRSRPHQPRLDSHHDQRHGQGQTDHRPPRGASRKHDHDIGPGGSSRALGKPAHAFVNDIPLEEPSPRVAGRACGGKHGDRCPGLDLSRKSRARPLPDDVITAGTAPVGSNGEGPIGRPGCNTVVANRKGNLHAAPGSCPRGVPDSRRVKAYDLAIDTGNRSAAPSDWRETQSTPSWTTSNCINAGPTSAGAVTKTSSVKPRPVAPDSATASADHPRSTPAQRRQTNGQQQKNPPQDSMGGRHDSRG